MNKIQLLLNTTVIAHGIMLALALVVIGFFRHSIIADLRALWQRNTVSIIIGLLWIIVIALGWLVRDVWTEIRYYVFSVMLLCLFLIISLLKVTRN